MFLLVFNSIVIRANKTEKFIKLKLNELANYAGNYWNINKNYYNQIDFHNDTLFFDNTDGFRVPLLCMAKDSFLLSGTDMKLEFSRSGKDHFMIFYTPESNSVLETFEKYDSQPPSGVNELNKYVGTYYCDKLKTTYKFSIEGDMFYWQINNLRKRQLFPTNSNIVWNSESMVWVVFAEIIFQFDSKGYITGLKIGDSRVKGVLFNKQSDPN